MKDILVGSIIGLLIGIVFAVSSYLKNRKTKQQIEIEKKTISQQDSFNVKKEALEQLKEKGILTEQEYEDKMKILAEDNICKSLETYDEYKQLKAFYEDGILTKEELESKVELLKDKLRIAKENGSDSTYSNKNEPSEGLILITDTDLNYGFTDIDGKGVIKTKYEYAESFKEGLALVRLDNKFGFIDKNGTEVIPFIYDDAESFENGKAKVKKGNESFYINKRGAIQ